MIKRIRHKGLRALFETGNTAGVRPDQVNRLLKNPLRTQRGLKRAAGVPGCDGQAGPPSSLPFFDGTEPRLQKGASMANQPESLSTQRVFQQPVKRLRRILAILDSAGGPADLQGFPGLRPQRLKGEYAGSWSVTVSGKWRLVFCFEGEDVTDVNLIDYH